MSVFYFSHHGKKRIRSFQRPKGTDDRFQALAQGSADVFWILTPKGEMQEICPSWQTFTGQDRNHYLRRGWLDAFHPHDQPRIEAMLLQTVTTGNTVETECHIHKADNEYYLVRIRIFPVYTRDRVMREIILCGNEVMYQKSHGYISEAQVQFALNVSGVGIWAWDILSDQIVWTDQSKALFGLPPTAPMTYQRYAEAVHPDDRESIEQFKAHVQSGQPHWGQEWYTRVLAERPKNYRIIWADGSIHWLENRCQMLYDEQGKPTHVVGATIDVTDLKRTEEALRQRNEELHILTEVMPQMVWIARPDGFHEYFNQQSCTYFNTTYEQLSGEQWAALLHPDDRQRTRERWHTALRTGQGYEIENRLREGKTGEYQWFLVRALPLIDDQGRILKWFGTCTNINEHKRAEEALRENEMRFRRLVEANIIGIVVSDPQGIIYEANDAFLSLVGYTREDLAARQVHWIAMTPPEYRERSMQAVKELLVSGVIHPFEKEYITKDGRRVPILLGSIILRREPTPLMLTFILDLTARKELERQKDLMLGMTSHELKTPLAALKGTFQLLQRRVRRLNAQPEHLSTEVSTFFHDLAERLAACVRQVDVQTHLINDLLDVSRITARTLQLDLDYCNLVSIVRETVEDLRMIAPERVLQLMLPEQETVQVFADRNRIGQVVTNYVTNALRYSRPEQPIQIGLTMEERVARVWVRDRGPGLSAEAQAALWQRFSQVQGTPVQSGSGKGLGLGLYICQTLIAQHHGEVGVESALGEGSTFWFTLPMV